MYLERRCCNNEEEEQRRKGELECKRASRAISGAGDLAKDELSEDGGEGHVDREDDR